MVDLGCGHEYCENCWRQYLTMTIKNGIGAEAISCPTEMCNIVIDDVTVMILLTDETVKRMYNHSITNSYIQVNLHIKSHIYIVSSKKYDNINLYLFTTELSQIPKLFLLV